MTDLEKRLCVANYLSNQLLDNKAMLFRFERSIKRYENLLETTKDKKLIKQTNNSIVELKLFRVHGENESSYIGYLIKALNIDTWIDQLSIEEQIELKKKLDLN